MASKFTAANNGLSQEKTLRYRYTHFGRNAAVQSSFVFDELGRMFSWGQNDTFASGQGQGGSGRPDLVNIEYATQIGDRRDWVKVSAGEMLAIALNTKGELWGWGQGNGFSSTTGNCCALALPENSGVSIQEWNGVVDPIRRYIFPSPVRVAPGMLFKDVATDYYHTLAIDVDNKLYVWGSNEYYALGLGVGVLEDQPVHTPIKHPILTADMKLVDCELFCSVAVTTDNRVYEWSWDWWYMEPTEFESFVPKEITGLPVGRSVTAVSVSGLGVVVILDNGELWGAGSSFLFGFYADPETPIQNPFPNGSATFQKITQFGNRVFTKVQTSTLGSSLLAVLDSDGNIWACHNDLDDMSGSDVITDAITWYDRPGLIAADFEGQRKFIDFAFNPHQSSAAAIDVNGYLWTWGYQNWGPYLADGSDYTTQLYRQIAKIAGEGYEPDGDRAYTNVIPIWDDVYADQEPQEQDHDPCGHWHVRLFNEVEEYPRNCWMPSIAIKGDEVFFVAAGRFPDARYMDQEKGFHILFFHHDLATRVWTLLHLEEMTHAGSTPGGAAFSGDLAVFANGKADVQGTPFNNTYSNFCIKIWVCNTGVVTSQDIPGTKVESCQNKLGCHSSGLIALAYTNAANGIDVIVSTDFGVTYNVVKTVAYDADRKDYSLTVDASGVIWLCHQVAASSVIIEKSIDQGANWTTVKTQGVTPNTLKLKFTTEGEFLYIFSESATTSWQLFSDDGGAFWYSGFYSIFPNGTIIAAAYRSNAPSIVSHVAALKDDTIWRYGYDTNYGWDHLYEADTEESLVLDSDNAAMVSAGNWFVYSAFSFYVNDAHAAVKLLVSGDYGNKWLSRDSPLAYVRDVTELTNSRCETQWGFAKLPGWRFDKSQWNTEFKKQQNKWPQDNWTGY